MGASELAYDPNCECTATRPSYYDPELAGMGVLLSFAISGVLALTLSTATVILRHAGGRTTQRIRSRIRHNLEEQEARRRRRLANVDSSTSKSWVPASEIDPRDTRQQEIHQQQSPLPSPSEFIDKPFQHDKNQTHHHQQEAPSPKQSQHRSLLTRFSTLSPSTLSTCNRWATGLERVVLGLSDQQLITSFIILLLALFSHTEEAEEGANVSFACDLVFYSSVTHAATLIALRTYLLQHPWVTALRMCLLYTTFVGWAGINVWWFTYVGWSEYGEWSTQYRFSVISQMVELVLLVLVYVDISIPIIQDGLIVCQKRLKHSTTSTSSPTATNTMKHNLDPWNTTKGWWIFHLLYRRRLHRIPIPIHAFVILWLLSALGTANLVFDLRGKYVHTQWGFGQLLPLSLCVLPFLTMVETYSDIQDAAAVAESQRMFEDEEGHTELRAPRPSVAVELGIVGDIKTIGTRNSDVVGEARVRNRTASRGSWGGEEEAL